MNKSILKNGLFGILLLCTAICHADTSLDTEHIDLILKQLTDQPQKTWLEHGTIQGVHMEYYQYEGIPIETTDRFVFDGTRFLWEITMHPENQPAYDVSDTEIRLPDRKINQHRIFCWDGSKYTQYFKSGNQAVISFDQQRLSQDNFGPFSAGVIQWGNDFFAYDKLLTYDRIGWKTTENGIELINLEITCSNTGVQLQMNVILDPQKNYAPVSFSMKTPGYSEISNTYDDYRQVNGQWIPHIILTERYDLRQNKKDLVSYEDWKFESIDSSVPASGMFNVNLKTGTLVEMHPSGRTHSWLYYAADQTDITSILEDKIALISTGTKDNCATAAVRHIAKRMSRSIPSEKLTGIISDQTQKTNLYQLRQTLQEAGLHCDSVSLDLDSLKELNNCKVILHLSASNHYVVLDRIDDNDVWYVDLTSRKFYWKKSIRDFLMEWTNGTALIVSENPVSIPVASKLLSNQIELNIRGGDFGSYSCTEVIQEDIDIVCPQPIGSLCIGCYYKYEKRYGCVEDESGGTCYGTGMPGYLYSRCSIKTSNWTECEINGNWLSRDIRACN